MGSYQCSCREGYELTSYWWMSTQTCQDINECWKGTSGCQQTCTNTVGSFVCSCYNGYQLGINGKSCEDVDECVEGTAKCKDYCVNTVGSYSCTCGEGFSLAADQISCLDVDECFEMNGGCEQTCTNLPGSYTCACEQGYQQGTDGKTCLDIDECALEMSGCSQNCQNKGGSFLCSCNEGFDLDEDMRTCSDIDDCVSDVCYNGGSCIDGLNSFSCLCSAGFTSTHCETDVNECDIYNGGCQEVCTNTEGSFTCDCQDGHQLRADGYTCSGEGDEDDNVFSRFEIGGGLLPEACFVLSLPQCTDDTNTVIRLKSTSVWYRRTDNEYYTDGITFVERTSITLPISIRGLRVTVSETHCSISHGADYTSGEGEIFTSEDTPKECLPYDFSESDVFDFISHGSFFKTYLISLGRVLPNWISFEVTSDSLLSIQDLKTDLMYGTEIKETPWCSDAPVLDDSLYNVFRFGSNFSISVQGEVIKLSLPKSQKFCFITELCHGSECSLFLMIPEDSRRLLEGINVFQQLKQKYSLSITPKGIGLSLLLNPTSDVQLWNGDTMFKYSQDEADVWISGDISIGGDIWVVHGEANIYMKVPDVNNMLTSIHIDEWNVYATTVLSPSLKLQLFGKTFFVTLSNILAEVEAYASFGGDQRTWCGEDSNPYGIFFSVMLDLSTPFEGIPMLEDWHSALRQKAYVFAAYEPFTLSTNIDIMENILQLNSSATSLLNLTTSVFPKLCDIIFFRNESLSFVNEIVNITSSIQNRIQEKIFTTGIQTLNEIRAFLNEVSSANLEIKHTSDLFFYDTEFINQNSFETFKELLAQEIDSFEDIVSKAQIKATNALISMGTAFTSYGIKYTANLVFKTIELGSFDLELVFSSSLFKCSRFDKINSHMEGEEALRVLGRASVKKQLNSFFSYEKGGGIGIALSVSSDRFVFQLQIFAKLLGMKATGDIFLTNNGLYLYLEGNVWDIFLAQVDVSAEVGEKWHDLTLRVSGRFLAKARKKRQIQTVNTSFQSSYLDGLKKVITFVTDAAKSRIDQAQNKLTKAQTAFTKAKNWLEEKQNKVNQAHSAFDKAIATLETAKEKLEDAKKPYEDALEKLRKAQRNVDNLCKIKDCPKVCIPGLKASICYKKIFWGIEVPYPCFSFTNCMIKIPDPVCEIANLACRAVRSLAFLALEAAKLFVRLPILVFDAAKAAVSVAQIIVDKSRVVLDVAETLMEVAQLGLDFAINVLEGAKLVLEGVKIALGAVAKVLELVIDYGLKNIIDVKNCGFDIEISTRDLPVFAVSCDVNAFKFGWRAITIKINFKNIVQSIWNAARATIDILIKNLSGLLGTGRKRREVAFKSSVKIHEGLLRHVRDIELGTIYSNESLDISYDIIGMSDDVEQDYESRVLLYKIKCQQITVVLKFMQESFDTLQNIVNESMQGIEEVNSLKDELQQYATNISAENMTLEDLGIDMEYAASDFNMTDDDFDRLIEEIKMSITNDSLLNEVSTTANMTIGNLDDALESMESINFVDTWFVVMANLTSQYFNASECVGFEDCVFYAVSTLYDIFEAEDIPNLDRIRTSILDVESIVLGLFQNETHSIYAVSESVEGIISNVSLLNDENPFCSLAPVFLSEMKNQTVLNSTEVVFTCNASGDPSPQFWWFKDEEYIQDENQMNMTIPRAAVEDSGVYICIAGNVVANITSKEAHLLVVTYDEDECAVGSDECEQICINVIASYECSCFDGYILNEDKRTCFGSEEQQEEKSTVTRIVMISSAAFLSTVVVVAVIFFAYTKLSKPKVIPSMTDIRVNNDTVIEKKEMPDGPIVQADRTIGPMKTSFNRHALPHRVAWSE